MAKQAKPARKPFEIATKEVFGEYPEDVLAYLKFSVDALAWTETLFHAIEELHGKEGSERHIKNLAGLGKYVAGDLSETYGCSTKTSAKSSRPRCKERRDMGAVVEFKRPAPADPARHATPKRKHRADGLLEPETPEEIELIAMIDEAKAELLPYFTRLMQLRRTYWQMTKLGT